MISYHFIVQSCYIIIDLIPYVYLISLRPIYPITRNMYLLIPFIYFDQNPIHLQADKHFFFSVFEFVSALFTLVSFLDSICEDTIWNLLYLPLSLHLLGLQKFTCCYVSCCPRSPLNSPHF